MQHHMQLWLAAVLCSSCCFAQATKGQIYTDFKDWPAAQQKWSTCVWAANTMLGITVALGLCYGPPQHLLGSQDRASWEPAWTNVVSIS